MKSRKLSGPARELDRRESLFRLINPDEYSRLGIDPQDVPLGTFAAEDHPGFLPSRFGGNAYGLGLVEQSVLNKADTDFIENLDFGDPLSVGRHAKRLNNVYQKLGLLIRFSHTGQRYFLIPINLVAHSLHEVTTKADEIEELIRQHVQETGTERLDIGLLTTSHDLIVHELTARLSRHRLFLFETVDKLRSWRFPLDIAVLPKDIFEYLLEQEPLKISNRSFNRQNLVKYATYLAGKIYDLLESNGKLFALGHFSGPPEDQCCHVQFKSGEELKSFLLFSHLYRTRGRYQANPDQLQLKVHTSDLDYYLNRFAVSEPHLKRLLKRHKPEDLTIEEINRLPNLNLHLPKGFTRSPERQWKRIFESYFDTSCMMQKVVKRSSPYWEDRLETDCEISDSLFVLVGKPLEPPVSLEGIEEELRASGMQGCSLPLVAEYRNTFRYVLSVLKILVQIRDHNFPKLSELERARLSNPFRAPNEYFDAVLKLLAQMSHLEKTFEVLNFDHIEGQTTPVLENIPKLSLHGFSRAQLREIVLIVVGHTTMSRIVFGKLPAKTLKPITDRAKEGDYQEILNVLRVCRLMSMAEIVAALGENFTGEQARELYRLYDDAIYVATHPKVDWQELNDLRISALGGVQNKAIREMLKFFNLFEFLNNWQEFMQKGAFEKEVICDYQSEKLFQLEDALELARIAGDFKRRFLGDYIFGQSYFFRQFLDVEFHGTGHLFPKLGARAGFILLWITVNASKRHIINFNPMLAGIPHDRREQRIAKIRQALLRIPIEQLRPGLYEEMKRTLEEAQPAFIFDTGIRMVNNPQTRALDVSFVDLTENMQQLDVLLSQLESQELKGISLKSLQDMERLFSEIESFRRYLHQEGCRLRCDLFDHAGGLEAREKEIERTEHRLRRVLQGQVFIPEEVYDAVSVLAKYCPEILRFILPEFHALGNLVGDWPTRQTQSVGLYVMRCLEKFQSLITKDRNAFQDRNTFYQLAKQEFGPLAGEGIGASHAQMEILEYLIDRVRQRPMLYQALTFALLYQEIGKIEKYVGALPEIDGYRSHAEAGALILERSEVLKKHDLSPQVEQLAILLVRHHGLIGHVIQGEDPITVLEQLITEQDDRLLDAYVLHAILAVASVQEGLMISDLLDVFLTYRAATLEILKSKSDWQSWLKESVREKGKTVLADSQLKAYEIKLFTEQGLHCCGFANEGVDDEALWRGRQVSALERLFKLMGATWVDYPDVQMALLGMPVTFINHKKKLKSVGPATFERQLGAAARLMEVVSSLSPEIRCYLLFCLDHLGAGLRIYDFHPLARFLKTEECLKLLLIAFQSLHHHSGTKPGGGTISFRPLSENIDRRYKALQTMLEDIPFPQRCFEREGPLLCLQSSGGLYFHVGNRTISVGYHDATQLDLMKQVLASEWDHERLRRQYEKMIRELREKLPYDPRELEKELERVFEEQRKKINDSILKSLQEPLSKTADFTELKQAQREIEEKLAVLGFTEEQQFLLNEMFEFHRARIRERYLDSIFRAVNAFDSKEALSEFWDRLKHELFSYRSYVGKEYESLIAELIDRKLEEM